MMGHRGRMSNGRECDALTRWKNVSHWNPGERGKIKRQYNKRQRKLWRQKTNDIAPKRAKDER